MDLRWPGSTRCRSNAPSATPTSCRWPTRARLRAIGSSSSRRGSILRCKPAKRPRRRRGARHDLAALAEDFIREDLADKRRGPRSPGDPPRGHPKVGQAASDEHQRRSRDRARQGSEGQASDRPPRTLARQAHLRLGAPRTRQGARQSLRAEGQPGRRGQPEALFGAKSRDSGASTMTSCARSSSPVARSHIPSARASSCCCSPAAAARRSRRRALAEIQREAANSGRSAGAVQGGRRSHCAARVDAAALLGRLPRSRTAPTSSPRRSARRRSTAGVERSRTRPRDGARADREPERWVIHDLRHTIRTRMAALGVSERSPRWSSATGSVGLRASTTSTNIG